MTARSRAISSTRSRRRLRRGFFSNVTSAVGNPFPASRLFAAGKRERTPAMTASRLQEDPAEGSRAIVEHELARQSAREEPAPKNNEKRATGADVEHLL